MRIILIWIVTLQTIVTFSVIAQRRQWQGKGKGKDQNKGPVDNNQEDGNKSTRRFISNDGPYKPIFGSHSFNPLSQIFETVDEANSTDLLQSKTVTAMSEAKSTTVTVETIGSTAAPATDKPDTRKGKKPVSDFTFL